MSSDTSNAKLEQAQGQSKPINVLQNQASLLYTNLHPILQLSTVIFSFKGLVADPVNTLTVLAAATAVIQAIYCIICLPSTGQSPAAPAKPGQKKKAQRQGQDVWAKVIPAFLSLLLTLTFSTPLLYIIIVLFGAPLTTHHPHTFLLALHLALLTAPQLFYVHGLDVTKWLQIASLQLPVDEVYGMSLGACVGAWVGAIPIPLDWDREWQKWPITVVTGLYIGAITGKLVGGYLFKGWRIKLS